MERKFLKVFLIGIAMILLGVGAWADGWVPTGSMNVARGYQTATMLPAPWSKVLVAGGSGNISSCELYDPVTKTWTLTGSMSTDRIYHTATLLKSNKILVTGGHSYGSTLPYCELYDPVPAMWTSTDSMNIPREHHTATELLDGRVLVTGGRNSGGVSDSCEVWNGTSWSSIHIMSKAREFHTATLLPNGNVFVAGGKNASGWVSQCDLFCPEGEGEWATFVVEIQKGFHTATLLKDGKVLIAGMSGCQLFDYRTDAVTPTGSMTTPREYHTATLLADGKVLVTGGAGAISSCEVYDPVTATWTTIDPMNTGREYHTVTLLPDNKVLVAGGYDGINYLSSCELWGADTPAIAGWPMYGHDLCNTHTQTGKGAMKDVPLVKWSYSTGGSWDVGIPALADIDGDGQLEIVFGSGNTMYAFDHVDNNGSFPLVVKWSYLTGGAICSSPAVADIDGDAKPEIVFGSKDNKIYCLNGVTGTMKWSYTTGGEIESSPAIVDIDLDGDLDVIVGSCDKKMYMLENDGAGYFTEHIFTTGGEIVSSPAIADIDNDGALDIVFGSKDNKCYCWDGLTGSLKWSYTTGGGIESSPAIADIDNDGNMEVVVGSKDNKCYCLNGVTGSLKWSYPAEDAIISSPAVADIDGDGKIEIVIGSNSTLLCLNWDGLVKWQSGSAGPDKWTIGNPAIADVDGDGYSDILTGYMVKVGPIPLWFFSCLDHEGNALWCIDTTFAGIGGPVIGDIDSDGNLEIVIGTFDGIVVLDDSVSVTLKGDISGNVLSDSLTPTPISGAYVHAFDSVGFNEGYAYTDSAGCGYYRIQNLVPGSYYVEVFAPGYIHEFYDDVADLANATPVPVLSGQITGLSPFILVKEDTSGEKLSGKVVDSQTGDPIKCIVTAFSSKSDFYPAVADSDGKYIVDGLSSSTPCYLYAWAPGYIAEYYDNALTWEAATEVTPTSDDIDFALAPATKNGNGGISGTITSSAKENQIGDVMVYAMDGEEAVGCARSWADGRYIIDGLTPGTYTVQASRAFYGTGDYSQAVNVAEDVISDIDIVITEAGIEIPDKETPTKTCLTINSSNPSIGTVAISYHLAVPTHTTLRIYNTSGRLVKTLVDSPKEANSYTITWNGRDNSGKRVPNGVYFCRLSTGEFKSVKKITLIR